ncbi:23S ribosomal RNA methyltransferase [Lentinus tigrinus ALCF2SS1-7]|uniref:rRNA methyltransferase 2, mitochondrial n=1 Tax=Lentinus tigrinus ALCF2SS1-6 TaxID=1328759 RepID=A0A5C2S1Z1_9APHY|nr:23S ribosomal RNA methyltransferase [Lentinus tigrinus ALCF2SS1-6]RPD71132.1 23S ribosomal RNA methyltransferase [Lentinus tigrinus ALCF2SS1-7]
MVIRPTLPLLSHKHSPSSRAWLARQFRDPYVKARLSSPINYRSRSAFKLVELENKWRIIDYKDVNTVIDLGAAPGGWSQVAAGKLGWGTWDVRPGKGAQSLKPSIAPSGYGLKKETKQAIRMDKHEKEADWSGAAGKAAQDEDEDLADPFADDLMALPPAVGRGQVIAVDLLRMEPIPGVKTFQMDFLSPSAEKYIDALLRAKHDSDGKAEVILSDMAANFTGNVIADTESSIAICESVFAFARRHLRTAESMKRPRGGALVLKHFAHPEMDVFRRKVLEPNFNVVGFDKPPSSRPESREGYWICLGFKGRSS